MLLCFIVFLKKEWSEIELLLIEMVEMFDISVVFLVYWWDRFVLIDVVYIIDEYGCDCFVIWLFVMFDWVWVVGVIVILVV